MNLNTRLIITVRSRKKCLRFHCDIIGWCVRLSIFKIVSRKQKIIRKHFIRKMQVWYIFSRGKSEEEILRRKFVIKGTTIFYTLREKYFVIGRPCMLIEAICRERSKGCRTWWFGDWRLNPDCCCTLRTSFPPLQVHIPRIPGTISSP